ncbi:MAG: renalase [Candidatus Deianiraeaceae bacterium]|jgi:renalase
MRIAIIGAGISGLTLARKLSETHDVEIFEKARGVGGRMSTRRVDDLRYNHGCQLFTAHSDQFQGFCTQMINQGVIKKFSGKVINMQNSQAKEMKSNKVYYLSYPYMNSLCKHLVKNLQIHLNTRITNITRSHHKWVLKSEDQTFRDFDILLITIPSPQVSDLLPKTFQYLPQIKQIHMSPCFALILRFNKNLAMNYSVANIVDSPIKAIFVNNLQSNSVESPTTIVSHATSTWSTQNIDCNQAEIANTLQQALQRFIHFKKTDIQYFVVHLWRYARATEHHRCTSFFDDTLQIGICGDWLASGDIEGGYLSALDLYEKTHTI